MKTRAERKRDRKLRRKHSKPETDWLGAIADFILLPFELLFYIFKD